MQEVKKGNIPHEKLTAVQGWEGGMVQSLGFPAHLTPPYCTRPRVLLQHFQHPEMYT